MNEEHNPNDVSSQTPPPVTGHPVIDDALAELGDLQQMSADDRLAKLSVAQETLVRVLEESRSKDDDSRAS